MLRSALVAAAVGVLLVGVPLLGLGAWTVTRQTEADLTRRAMVLQLLVAGSNEPMPELAGQVEMLLSQGRNAGRCTPGSRRRTGCWTSAPHRPGRRSSAR